MKVKVEEADSRGRGSDKAKTTKNSPQSVIPLSRSDPVSESGRHIIFDTQRPGRNTNSESANTVHNVNRAKETSTRRIKEEKWKQNRKKHKNRETETEKRDRTGQNDVV